MKLNLWNQVGELVLYIDVHVALVNGYLPGEVRHDGRTFVLNLPNHWHPTECWYGLKDA